MRQVMRQGFATARDATGRRLTPKMRQIFSLLKPLRKSAKIIQKEPSRGLPPRAVASPGWLCHSEEAAPQAPRHSGAR